MLRESQVFFYVPIEFSRGGKGQISIWVGSFSILKSGPFVSSGWTFDGKGQPLFKINPPSGM